MTKRPVHSFNVIFPDIRENYSLTVEDGVMNYGKSKTPANPDATITLDRSTLDDIAGQAATGQSRR